MGWDGMVKPQDMSMKDYIKKMLYVTGGKSRIVDCSIKGSTAYLAIQHNDKPEEIYGAVCLISKHSDGKTFLKTMEESMGLYYYDCPQKILSLLTPLEDTQRNEGAIKWRQACQENIDREKLRPSKIVTGDKIIFEEPLKFTDGTKCKTFTSIDPPKHTFLAETGALVRLMPRNLADYDKYSIVRNGETIHAPVKPIPDATTGELEYAEAEGAGPR